MGNEDTDGRSGKMKAAIGAIAGLALGWMARMWRRRERGGSTVDKGLTDPEAKPEIEEWGNESFPASDPPANY